MKSLLFKEEDPGTVAFLRIGVGIVFFFDAIIRWPYVIELYTTDGQPMPLHPESILKLWSLDAVEGVLLYSLLLFGLICIIIGWKTRWNLALVFALSICFGLLDSAGTFKKYSVIELHLLFLLFFSNCHLRWSVDAQLKKTEPDENFTSPAWPRFLIKILITNIYLQSVITKVRLGEFTTGDVLFFNMLDDRWGGNWLGLWIATMPVLMIALSWGTIAVEALAGTLLWFRAARIPMLLIAYSFHFGIWITMHVGVFSPLMLFLIIAFVGVEDWVRMKAFCGRVLPAKMRGSMSDLRRRSREKCASWSKIVFSRIRSRKEEDQSVAKKVAKEWACYALVASVFVVVGYQYQQYFDRYHVFEENAEMEWTILPEDFIDEITRPQKVALSEYVLIAEAGEMAANNHAFGLKKKFPLGSTLSTVVRLDRDHPGLEIEYILRLDDGNTAETYEARKKFYVQPLEIHWRKKFYFSEEETDPGDYIFILQVEDVEVFRKRFEIVAK